MSADGDCARMKCKGDFVGVSLGLRGKVSKGLAALLAGLLVVGALPASALADEVSSQGGVLDVAASEESSADAQGSFEAQATASVSIETPRSSQIAGASRYATAARIVEQWAAENGAPGGVIVASAAQYADALGASGLAGVLGYPILLTHPTQLLPETAAALGKLGANLDIVVVGGEAAVGASVERALSPYGSVTRLAGSTRYETNDEILAYGASHGGWRGTPIVATGRNYADALAISPYAYWSASPVILADTALSERSGEVLSSAGTAVVLGGTSAVSEALFNEVRAKASTVERLSGPTRYATGAEILSWELAQGMSVEGMGFATGANFPDALASGALLGAQRGSVLALVNPGKDNEALLTQLRAQAGQASQIAFFGGVEALPQAKRNQVLCALASNIELGSYEQDGNAGNGKEPIEWRVLAISGNSALLVSEYALDAKPFNASGKGNDWNTSSLRSWLTGEFASEAGLRDYANPLFAMNSGEIEKYFGSNEAHRICKPTVFAMKQGAYVTTSGACYWWLRSAGTDGKNCAAYVRYDGSVNAGGEFVEYDRFAVRPAMWVRVSANAG